MLNLLAVDTTHGVCSVALMQDGVVTGDVEETEQSKQAERLLPIIESVLAEGGITYSDLSAIAVNIGPGSFTGVRIGMAAVKGLHLVHPHIKLISVTSFESVAYPCLGQPTLVVLDARRGQVFCQLLGENGAAAADGVLLSYEDVAAFAADTTFILTGNGSDLVSEYLASAGKNFRTGDASATSCAKNIIHVAEKKHQNEDFATGVCPLYIRLPDAKVSTK